MSEGSGCRLIGLVVVLGLFVIAFTPLSNVVGGWLYTPPRLGPAGAIVVLGGPESERRAILGLVLYRLGFAPLLAFSGGPREVRHRVTLARNLGVPSQAILSEPTARTTQDEAGKIGALLRARGIRRIILVTDVLGMRRAQGVFERAGFEVLPAPSTGPFETFGPPQEQIEYALSIVEEAAGYFYYRLMGYL